MKAVVRTKYRPPEILEPPGVEKPLPKDNELLIKIFATTVTAADCETLRMDFPFNLSLSVRLRLGLLKPKEGAKLGTKLAGGTNSLTPVVTYLQANPLRGQMVRGPWRVWRSSHKVVMQTASSTVEDLVYPRTLIEEGELRTVIDHSYPLEKIFEAHCCIETGAKIGSVVITLAHDGRANEGIGA